MANFLPEGALIDTLENRQILASIPLIQEAMHTGRILEARATLCDARHNLIVDLGVMKGLIPRSEGALGIEDGSTRDIAVISRVGKAICFKVTEIKEGDDGKPLAVLSRLAAQKECMASFIKKLAPGDIIPAKVTHLEPFGCFVDIGCGIASLIPIDSISVSRISHPKDRFQVGSTIKAIVREVDETGRVFLTHKELLGTWEENAAYFSPGETVSGIIRTVEDYGIFVELTPNLAGLAEPKEGAKPGQRASVYIKSILPDKMKIKLIIVDSFQSDEPPMPMQYFVEGSHMDHWQYSPDCSSKLMEVTF